MEFLVALNNSVVGHMPLQMMYFYKYLVHHGDQNKQPLIDRDLFYYWEVQKFKVSSHHLCTKADISVNLFNCIDCWLFWQLSWLNKRYHW